MNKRIITIPFLCGIVFVSLSNNAHSSAYEFSPRDEARFAVALASIDDSGLRNHQGYQKWKKVLMETQSGRALLAKWNDLDLTVHIAMGENSGGPAGATTTDFIFDRGKLISAKIVLGKDFAKSAPLNVADYPVLSSLSDDGQGINREVRGLAFLAHEFGHVEFARMGGVVFQRQNQLLHEHNAGYANFGFDWFKRPEYRRLVAELGVAPLELRRQVRRPSIGAESVSLHVVARLREYSRHSRLNPVSNYNSDYKSRALVADSAPGAYAPHTVTCDWIALAILLGHAAFGRRPASVRPTDVALQPA